MKIVGYVLCSLFVSATAVAAPLPGNLAGDWKLGTVVGYADESSGPADAESLIGASAHLNDTDFMLPRSSCTPQAPSIAIVDVSKVLMDDMHSPRSDLDIKKSLLGRRAPYISGKCVSAFILTDRSLVVFAPNGAMYRAKR